MLVWKEIKPKRLKVDAIRLEMLNEMRKVGTGVKKDFEKTAETWKKKPKFEVVISLTPPGPAIVVDTNDEIYRYVNDGTRAHIILPRTKSVLKFREGYIAKTNVGFIGSFHGGPYGSDVYSRGVIHPGTKARNFDKEIQKLWVKPFKRRMQKALSRGAKKSGHGIP